MPTDTLEPNALMPPPATFARPAIPFVKTPLPTSNRVPLATLDDTTAPLLAFNRPRRLEIAAGPATLPSRCATLPVSPPSVRIMSVTFTV
jgi:hypothetical protein